MRQKDGQRTSSATAACYDYLVDGKGSQAGLGSASLVLYFAVTYTIQRLILQARSQRLAGAPQDIRDPLGPAPYLGDRRLDRRATSVRDLDPAQPGIGPCLR